jgi:hypothetical protein
VQKGPTRFSSQPASAFCRPRPCKEVPLGELITSGARRTIQVVLRFDALTDDTEGKVLTVRTSTSPSTRVGTARGLSGVSLNHLVKGREPPAWPTYQCVAAAKPSGRGVCGASTKVIGMPTSLAPIGMSATLSTGIVRRVLTVEIRSLTGRYFKVKTAR